MITMYVKEDQTDWDQHLPYVMMAYRASEHASTKTTPNQLMFGREALIPLDLLAGKIPGETGSVDQYTEQLHHNLRVAFEKARVHTKAAQEQQKRLYDTRQMGKPFCKGDLVWLYTYRKKRGRSPKFQAFWKGPFKVIQKLSDANYRIRNKRGGRPQVVHFDCLKPYEARSTSSEPESLVYSMDDSQLHPDVQDSYLSMDQTAEATGTDMTMESQVNEDDSWGGHALPAEDPVNTHLMTRHGRKRNAPAWMRAGDFEL